MSERTLLAQMLWELKEAGDGLSYKKMSTRSGGLVAVSTLHSVMSGKTRELTPDTITGIAKILNVSEAHVLAALKDKSLTQPERASEEKERLWAMYEDIPRQCQQDVLDLLEVLQRNHSISARQAQRTRRSALRPVAIAAAQLETQSKTVAGEEFEITKQPIRPIPGMKVKRVPARSNISPSHKAARRKKQHNGS